MTSTIDVTTIGRPSSAAGRKVRRHVRSLTGDFPEVDERGQEKWPRGDEQTWKGAMRGLYTGKHRLIARVCPPLTRNRLQMSRKLRRQS